ncbi:MAG: hypothetical protein KDM63_09545 [Verrucomicrobiae bacterium]|nr:hypothetical protein [Verrucomicrobiae bacterium]MCB1087276.1 hypothetical protein [Verrucomicrobiae bacterium]
MKPFRLTCLLGALAGAALLSAAGETTELVKAVKDHAGRGTLSDQRQLVRGDTGKWSGTPALLHAPPLARKPAGLSLDDWIDELAETKPMPQPGDDHWLLFRTRQLDDNDRVWIETIERRGREFIVTMHEAIWQGKYFKTFTYYEVSAVNLGKLPPGDYSVKWIVKPRVFKQLEKPREAQNNYQTNWPTDDEAGSAKTVEVTASFSVP